jgi:hypothetical protein
VTEEELELDAALDGAACLIAAPPAREDAARRWSRL